MLEFLKKSLPILVVAALVLSGTTAVADIITDLEVHYTFDDDTMEADLGYNAVTAVNDNLDGSGALTQVAGPGGSIPSAASFGTAADTRHIESAGKSYIGEGSYTFAAWFNTDDVWADRMSIIQGRDGWQPDPDNDPGWWVYGDEVLLELGAIWGGAGQEPGKLADALVEGSGGSYIWLHPSGDLADGVWHHMASTWDGDSHTLSLYLDGALIDSNSNVGVGALDIQDGFQVGIRNEMLGSEDWPFSGSLADVRMYGRSLSGDDIVELHALSIPEPSSVMLAALGLLSLAFAVLRRRGK